MFSMRSLERHRKTASPLIYSYASVEHNLAKHVSCVKLSSTSRSQVQSWPAVFAALFHVLWFGISLLYFGFVSHIFLARENGRLPQPQPQPQPSSKRCPLAMARGSHPISQNTNFVACSPSKRGS